jgi:hypothetical protein
MRANRIQRTLIIILSAAIVFSGCAPANNQAGPGQSRIHKNSEMRIASQFGQVDTARIAITEHEGNRYVPLDEIIQALEFNMEWDEESQTYQIGDTDPEYIISANTKQIQMEDEQITVETGLEKINGEPFVPITTVEKLFGEIMNYRITGDFLFIYPQTENLDLLNLDEEGMEEETTEDEELDFAEDPDDPYKNEAEEAMADIELAEEDLAAVPVLKNINMSSLVRRADNYLGVRYKFGAKPYPRSRRFDCSSYTKYVFGKYGVKLYRLARNQAKQGKAVSRKRLRRGDLLFFYVPGRFRSNKVVGHVGIYIGNGRMIHATPKRVKISRINARYWKRTFLKARRVAY